MRSLWRLEAVDQEEPLPLQVRGGHHLLPKLADHVVRSRARRAEEHCASIRLLHLVPPAHARLPGRHGE